MHRRFIAVAVAAVVAVLGFGLVPASASADPVPNYYLALGDSLAAGYQPGSGVDPTGGYVGPTLAKEIALNGATTLENLGCPGENTNTMINGGKCPGYTTGSQLGDAVAFLAAHSGQVGLITLDIGANNVDDCVVNGAIDFTCLQQGIAQMQQDLPTIYHAIRAAAPLAQVIVANYYDPFLAFWLQGAPGQRAPGEAVAKASVPLLGQINGIIAGNATAPTIVPAFQVADVATAFQSTNFHKRNSPFGRIPINVYRICTLTHMCVGPGSPDIHPTDGGYAVIGATVSALVTTNVAAKQQ